MHTITLTTIISLLLLPLLTTAEGPTWRPSVWPPVKQPYYWGDMLNITKCYCQAVKGDTHPSNYFQFDYRNFHNGKVYTLGWTCHSDDFATGWAQEGPERVSFPLPECWNGHSSWRKEKRRRCVKNAFADKFCIELGNTADPNDYYYFNGQRRGLPDFGIVEYPPDMCAALCRDKVGGEVASDTEGGSEKSLPSLETRLMTLKGSFKSYTSLDDMDDNY